MNALINNNRNGVYSVIGPFETIEEARNYEETQIHALGLCSHRHLILNLTKG